MIVTLAPVSNTPEVVIEMHQEALSEALSGNNLDFCGKKVSVKDAHCVSVTGDSKNDPPMGTAGSGE